MMKYNDETVLKAIAICFKPYLKPEEAMIYCNLGRTQLTKKCEQYGIFKNINGYYRKEDLDLVLSGSPTKYEEKVRKLKI
ncbi:MAG: hypothetical protein M3139_05020 [Bacteroidota bacterium]|nr:hypothetical protein [Bacteroidota bacterium]